MAGVRGYTPRFGSKKNMCGYGSFKVGGGFTQIYGYLIDGTDAWCLNIEAGVHLSNTFFMGLSYNMNDYVYFWDGTLYSVMLRLGFHFGK